MLGFRSAPVSDKNQGKNTSKARSARITFSAILKNAGGTAFTRCWFQVQEAIVKMHTNAHDLKSLTTGSNRSLRSLGPAEPAP